MNVLIACEFSGIVREEFARRGHNAWSCDLEPSEQPTLFHWVGDVLELLGNDSFCHSFDLMIAHPPCTHLASSGARWFWQKRESGQQQEAVDFFMALANVPIRRICIENPVGIMSRIWRKPDQIIQPWQFGHGETKATCLWLKNLPPLQPTRVVSGREQRIHRMPPSPERGRERSRTYHGIAVAMANQWGVR